MAEMRKRIYKLSATPAAVRKLGARGISVAEAQQIAHNHYETKPNPGGREGESRRIFLVGFTDGGRPLTLVIEETFDLGYWKIITGWVATKREREILG